MWVRIGSFRVQPGEAEQLRTIYNGQAVPKVRAFPGNVGCLLLEPTAGTDEFLVLTLWQDQTAAERYESSGAAAEVVALVKRFFAGPPALRSYSSASPDDAIGR